MPTVKGCNLPDDLLYDVENQIWFKEIGDGTVRIGMTAVATAMAGRLVAFTCANGLGEVIMPCGRCRQLLWEHGGPDLLVDGPVSQVGLLSELGAAGAEEQ